jgi:hypothetical protein
MQSWWGTLPREGLRPALRALLDCGLLHRPGGTTGSDASFEVEENCWAAARGEAPREPCSGVQLRPAVDAPRLDELLLPDDVRLAVDRLAPQLATTGGTLIVRGPDNGRGARRAGAGGPGQCWPSTGPAGGREAPPWRVRPLTGARPLFRLRVTPGERLRCRA